MLASHSIGPVLLLMSLFGTTMTGFALVGSTGESFKLGISVYAMLASASGIVHSLCFFVIGVKLWTFGRRFGYTTQIQFFRDRLDAPNIGLVLFPVLVAMVVIYLLIGVIPSGAVIAGVTRGAFPEVFPATDGGVPAWLGSSGDLPRGADLCVLRRDAGHGLGEHLSDRGVYDLGRDYVFRHRGQTRRCRRRDRSRPRTSSPKARPGESPSSRSISRTC